MVVVHLLGSELVGPGPDPLVPEAAGRGPGKKAEAREPAHLVEEPEPEVGRAGLGVQLVVPPGELEVRLEEPVAEMGEEQAQAEGTKVEGPEALP